MHHPLLKHRNLCRMKRVLGAGKDHETDAIKVMICECIWGFKDPQVVLALQPACSIDMRWMQRHGCKARQWNILSCTGDKASYKQPCASGALFCCTVAKPFRPLRHGCHHPGL